MSATTQTEYDLAGNAIPVTNPLGQTVTNTTFYTLIGNCHRVGLKAENHLTELFKRPPRATTKTVNELTPHAMAPRRRAAAKRSASEQSAGTLATA